MTARSLVGVLLLALAPRVALAQTEKVSESKEYFRAGAAAYAAGDYLAAIQALEAAHRLTPLPAIAFSLAQAERRQYFVSREPRHLKRAIELFRSYLDEVPTGGRRVDATDALAQLEPLAFNLVSGVEGSPASVREPPKTRLMVSSEAPSATISLDGQRAVPSPLIEEVAPGTHSVRVSARGFFSTDRRVTAVQGALVPVEIVLRERPSLVSFDAPEDADLYVDGTFVGSVGDAGTLELSSGPHVFNLALKGRHIKTLKVNLGRGEARTLKASLLPTGQRIAARSLFVTSGAALAAGLLLTGLAVREENRAEQILGKLDSANIRSSELDQYEDALEMRSRLRLGAAGSFAVSLAAIVTGVVLHEFDTPSIQEASAVRGAKRKQKNRAVAALEPAAAGVGCGVRVDF